MSKEEEQEKFWEEYEEQPEPEWKKNVRFFGAIAIVILFFSVVFN